jgi:chromosome segregation protein
MYLKSLEINGFKSFGKKADLDFSVPITAIVGPNGSGKSNVAEAFRFVLGEQSMKSMRGKRGEDMIFNGAKSMPKLNRASVRLVFDNARRIFDFDFDEIVIERVVFRDSANEYFINGSQVRLRDVIELLASANIGSSGHHIISQGEADRLLNASTRERKAMIEDALGLKIFQYKREESLRKLEKTEENMNQVESLRKEIAPHIRFLERQMEKVKKAELLREELTNFYREYLKREEIYLHFAKKNILEEKKGPILELDNLDKEIQEIRNIIEKSSVRDRYNDEILKVESNLHNAEEHESQTQNSISRILGEISAQERAYERAKNAEAIGTMTQVPLRDIENLGLEFQKIAEASNNNENVPFLKSVIVRFVEALNKFIHERKQNSGDGGLSEEIKAEIDTLFSKKNKLESDLREASESKVIAKREYEDVRKRMANEETEGREAERKLFSLMNKRSELISLVSSIKYKEDRIIQSENNFKSELVEAQALVGVPALHFNDLVLLNTDGSHLEELEVANEDRGFQEERKKKLEKLKIRLEETGGSGGDDVKKEYVDAKERDDFLAKELIDLGQSATTLKELISDLEVKLNTQFGDGVGKINTEFNKFFGLMFGGGQAFLSISKEVKRKKKSDTDLSFEESDGDESEDSGDIEEGVDISVSLPHKRIKGLSMLSGGERALTSIALLFAISQVNPPPFVILDETDAALDEANSKKYGDMIENLSRYSQLILITHNRETMSRAGILYGVTMGSDGYSKLLSVKFDEAVSVAK